MARLEWRSMLKKFATHNPYASITLHSASERNFYSVWTNEHAMQGFCVRAESMGFRTSVDEFYEVVITDELAVEDLLPEALFAVRLPLLLTDANAFVDEDEPGSSVCIPSSVTHVCFVELPGCRAYFLLESSPLSTFVLLKPAEELSKRADFMLSADPMPA